MSEASHPTPATTLADLDGWWLCVSCDCGRSVDFPCRLLARDHNRRSTAGEILDRLRCQRCGRPPSRAELVDNPHHLARVYAVDGAPATVIPLRS